MNIRPGKDSLIPCGQAQIDLINTIADPVAPPGASNGNTYANV